MLPPCPARIGEGNALEPSQLTRSPCCSEAAPKAHASEGLDPVESAELDRARGASCRRGAGGGWRGRRTSRSTTVAAPSPEAARQARGSQNTRQEPGREVCGDRSAVEPVPPLQAKRQWTDREKDANEERCVSSTDSGNTTTNRRHLLAIRFRSSRPLDAHQRMLRV